MMSFLSRWRPAHLITAWVAYWVGLAAVTLTPTVMAIVHGTRLPKDAAAVSASFSNTVLSITVSEFGKVTHAATASMLQVSLWVGLPPLLLYVAWLSARPRARPAPAQLGEPPLDGFPRPDAAPRASSSSTHSRAPHA